MPKTAEAFWDEARSQEQGIPSGSPKWTAGTEALGPASSASQSHYQKAGLKVEAGFDPKYSEMEYKCHKWWLSTQYNTCPCMCTLGSAGLTVPSPSSLCPCPSIPLHLGGISPVFLMMHSWAGTCLACLSAPNFLGLCVSSAGTESA